MPHQQQTSQRSSRIDNQLIEALSSNEDVGYILGRLVEELEGDLKEKSLRTGVSQFLDRREGLVAESTIVDNEYKLSKVIEFCEIRQVNDLSEIDGEFVDDFEIWLHNESSDEVDQLSKSTMADYLYLFRDFLRYLEKIEVVRDGLSDKVEVPKVSRDEGIRNVELSSARAQAILEYLNEFEYAKIHHIAWLLLTTTGRRSGGVIGLDLEDAHLDVDDPYLEFNHRDATPLKNRSKGEGVVAISTNDARAIRDYIENYRPNVVDSNGRKPLLATRHDRLSTLTLRRYVYAFSRPCVIGKSCPDNRSEEVCEAMESRDKASKCPASRSPHSLRHGYISECRRSGVPDDVISDRVDATPEVLRNVYDESTNEERLGIRRRILDEISADNQGGYL